MRNLEKFADRLFEVLALFVDYSNISVVRSRSGAEVSNLNWVAGRTKTFW